MRAALEQIGARYEWGGRGPDTFDCSGLIVLSYKQANPSQRFVYRNRVLSDATMASLWKYNVQPLALEEIRPGDIVFITNSPHEITHGGLFVRWLDPEMSAFEFVNASSYEEYNSVVLDWWPVEGEKRSQWFIGAGRLKSPL